MCGMKRSRGLTMEQRVWRWVRSQDGPVKVRDIVAQTGFGKQAVVKTLQRLVAKGSIIRKGVTHSTTYTATNVSPDDFRGTAPGTLETLYRYTAANLQRGIRV